MADVTPAADAPGSPVSIPGVVGTESEGHIAPAGTGTVRRTRQPRPARMAASADAGADLAVEASVAAESPPTGRVVPATSAAEVARDLTPRPAGPSGPGGPGGGQTAFRAHPSPYEWESPGVPYDGSTYMQYLPGIYSTNRFLARFLLIFEAILAPIDRTIENIASVFDPDVAPADVLPWLGSWLGLAFDEGWPEERRRELIRSAAMLYHWRGTKRGMSEFVRIYTGVMPEIVEPTLSQLSNSRDLAFRFTVRLTVPRGAPIDRALLQRIIDAEKPAFAAGTLEVIEVAVESNGRVSHH